MIKQKRIALLMAGTLLAALLTACGSEPVEVTTIEIDKEGALTSVIYDEFSEDYLSVDELSEMATREIEAYNSEYLSERVSLGDVEYDKGDKFVKFSMNFKSAEDFSNFNQETVFYGTLGDARDAGYTISTSLVDRAGDSIDASFIEDHPDSHIIITTDKANFKTPYKIRYMSKGVVLLNDKEAVLQDVTGDSATLLLAK